MGSEGKSSQGSSSSGVFNSRMKYYMNSGEKKHVFAGIVIISVVFGIPWYLMSRGSKQQSHQDYMEKADKARKERLSPGSSSAT